MKLLFPRWRSILVGVGICLSTLAIADDGAIIDHGSEALGLRLQMIRNAKTEVLISTFVTTPSEAHALIGRELIAAAAPPRNVRVQYLVDAHLVDKPEKMAFLYYLKQNGVDVRLFRPYSGFLQIPWYYVRMHGKKLIVDGHTLMSGGRNDWNESFGIGHARRHLDVDIVLRGQAATKGRDAFLSLWKESVGNVPTSQTPEHLNTVKALFDRADSAQDLPGFDHQAYQRGLAGPTFAPMGDVEMVEDSSKAGQTSNHIGRLIEIMDSARERLYISSPWIVLTDRIQRALVRAKARGVDIRLLTNSEQTSERRLNYLVTRITSVDFLNRSRIPLFELTGENALHSKIVLADDTFYLGSFNLGPRDEYANIETGVVVASGAAAVQVKGIFENYLATSRLAPPYDPSKEWKCYHLKAWLYSSQY